MSEMSDGQRTLLAISLSLLVLLLWAKVFAPKIPVEPPKSAAPSPASAQTTNPAPSPSPVSPAAIQAAEERPIVIESSICRVELSNRGGVVKSWRLKNYLDDRRPAKPLELVNGTSAQQLGAWPFSLALEDPKLEAAANTGLYEVGARSLRPAVAGSGQVKPAPTGSAFTTPAEFVFHWSDGHLDVAKRLKFADDYQTNVEISASLDGKPLPLALAWRGGFGDQAVYKAAQSLMVYYSESGKLNFLPIKNLGVKDHQEQRQLQAGPLEYAGIEDQFFTAAFLPDSSPLELYHWVNNVDVTPASSQDKQYEPRAEMAAGTAAGTLRLRVFVGPKDLKILTQLHPPLEGLVQFGWVGFLAKPMLEILNWLHRYIPNYGWAIVVFTLLITMALFPIRVWNFRSMKKMQRVAPEIRQIQDRYKKYSLRDPRKQKMNEEIMAVYNREGVNPMGSCLPMVAQLPILWAFYRMLVGAIELRHAPWFGWIHDLSARDPYFILPILMMLATYLSSKMTPMTGVDPTQQKTMQFMTLGIGFIFFYLSSGLNLYYLTSNVIIVAQQYYLNRTEPLPSRSRGKNKSP